MSVLNPKTRLQPYGTQQAGVVDAFGQRDPLGTVIRKTVELDTGAGQFMTRIIAGERFGVPVDRYQRRIQKDFNPYSDPETLRGYERWFKEFQYAASPEEVEMIKVMIDRNIDLRTDLEDHTLGRLLGNVFDPINVLPLGLALGKGWAAGAKIAAATGGAPFAASELLRHGIDPTSTKLETTFNIAGGMLFMSLMGAAGGKFVPDPDAIRVSRLTGKALDYLVPVDKPVAGTPQMSIGVPAGYGLLRNIYKRVRQGYETTANKIADWTTPSDRVVKRKDGKGLAAELEEGPILMDGTRMKPVESDFYPIGYVEKSPLEAMKNHFLFVKDREYLIERLEDQAHLDLRAEQTGKTAAEIAEILDGELARTNEYLRKSAEFFNREDVQKQVALEKELGLDQAARVKNLDDYELVNSQAIDIVRGVPRPLRSEFHEFQAIVADTTKRFNDKSAEIDALRAKIAKTKDAGWKTRYQKQLDTLEEQLKHRAMDKRIAEAKLADIRAIISNKNARELVVDWQLAPAALNKIMQATKQFPWWYLLKNDFRKIDPLLGREIQEFALAMASSPGLNTKGNVAFRSLGASVEALKHEWMGPYYVAKRHKEKMYTKYLGLGEDTTQFNVYVIDSQQRFKAFREKISTKLGRPKEEVPDQPMSFQEFNEAVSDAMMLGGHEIPEIESAAKAYHKVFSDMGTEAKKLGIFETQRGLLRSIDKANTKIAKLEQDLRKILEEHPESKVYEEKFDELAREKTSLMYLERRHAAYEAAGSKEFEDAGYFHIMYDHGAIKAKKKEVVEFLVNWFNRHDTTRVGDEIVESTMSDLELRARAEETYSSMLREAELGDSERLVHSLDKREWLVARSEELEKLLKGTSMEGMRPRKVVIRELESYTFLAEKQGSMEAAQIVRSLKNELDAIYERLRRFSRQGGEDMVTAYFRKEIIADKLARIANGTPTGSAGPLLARHLDIPAKDLADLGILIKDIDTVTAHYVSRLAPAIETARKFGTPTAQGHINRIVNKMRKHAAKLEEDGKPKAAANLRKKIEAYKESMEDLRDITLGWYQIPENPAAITPRVLRMIRNFNMLAAMGRSVFMAFGDVGNIVISQGFRRTFGHMFGRYTSGLHSGNIRMIDAEVELAGAVTEVALGLRYHSYAELGHQWAAGTKFEKAVADQTQRFFLHNLMGPWTDMAKRVAGGLVQSKLIENSVAWKAGKLKPSEAKVMNRLNINKERAIQIADEWEASGSLKHKAMFIANTEQWVSDEARRAFRAAINDEVNRAVIVPGVPDKPKALLKSEWWKVFGQYKGFGMSASNRIFAAGLQQEGMSKISGMLSMVAIATLVDAWKRPDYIDMSIDEQILRAVELSGMTGLILDINDTLERASAGSIGLRPLFGMDIRERNPNWANRMGALLGAAPNQWLTLIYGLTSDEASTNDAARGIRYMVPYNNLWMFNEGVNRIQRASVDFFGE